MAPDRLIRNSPLHDRGGVPRLSAASWGDHGWKVPGALVPALVLTWLLLTPPPGTQKSQAVACVAVVENFAW